VKEGDLINEKFIVNFPTKQHWRVPSEISYIQDGLVALKKAIKEYDIQSIAIPPLGCGLGGLDWNVVKPMIIEALQDLDINIDIYEPG